MNKLIGFVAVLALMSLPALGQRENAHGQPNVGHGYIPPRGPAPSHGIAHPAQVHGAQPEHPAQEHPNFRDQPGHPNAPHVHTNGQWVGHDSGPGDVHYHLDHPFEHGHFMGGIGRGHIWRLEGGGPSRFWFGGFYWSVAPYDLAFCSDWNWDGDQIVIYDEQYT